MYRTLVQLNPLLVCQPCYSATFNCNVIAALSFCRGSLNTLFALVSIYLLLCDFCGEARLVIVRGVYFSICAKRVHL